MENKKTKTRKIVNELVAGSMAGVFQTVSGHPLDTLKLRMQASKERISLGAACKDIVAKDGYSGFFRGMLSPIAGAGLQNIFIFGSNQLAREFICVDPTDPTVTEAFFSGLIVAPSLALPLAPVDVLKCRLQVQSQMNPILKFNGPMQLAKHMLNTQGYRSLFQGYGACVVRELFVSIYFGANVAAKKFIKSKKDPGAELSMLDFLFCGGVAGVSFWTACYPIDMIKSRIQIIDTYKTGGKHPGMVNIYKQIVAESGHAGLYKGFTPCFFRSFIVNGFVFLGYDLSMKFLNNMN
mmetsp:Transcript_11910/g.17713  ORF Transcript_11910/g.17713 Transcript_11910/m.17713 type:complete len:294 (-) Transcript_11910:87-968(-)